MALGWTQWRCGGSNGSGLEDGEVDRGNRVNGVWIKFRQTCVSVCVRARVCKNESGESERVRERQKQSARENSRFEND